MICPGDLFIWAVPNDGNPQKVQRYPWDPRQGPARDGGMRPGRRCVPVTAGRSSADTPKIVRMLTETAQFLEDVTTRTLAAMEAGSPPHVDIVTGIELPVSDSPWLQPVYDDTEFLVRNIIRYYGGCGSGRPSELKPAPRAELARRSRLCAAAHCRWPSARRRWRTRARCGLPAISPISRSRRRPRILPFRPRSAAIYETRAGQETSLMTINIFNSAAAYAKAGRPYA